MKTPSSILLFVCALALSACDKVSSLSFSPPEKLTPAPAAPVTPTPATLGKVQALIVVGDVKLLDGTNKARALMKGDTFQEGSIIVAGPASSATLVFSNGATLRLKENSQLKINKFSQAPFDEAAEGSYIRLTRDPSKSITDLDFRGGSISGEVKSLNKAAGSTFQIHTPTQGTANIDGIFSLSELGTTTAGNAPSAIQISAVSGVISVEAPGGNTTSAQVQEQVEQLRDAINAVRTQQGLAPAPSSAVNK